MLNLFRGGKAMIKLVPERTRCQPGEQVRVQVTVSSEKDLTIREGRVALVYQAEYLHSREVQRRDSQGRWRTERKTEWRKWEHDVEKVVILPEGVLAAGTETVHECTLTIPLEAPPTCAGGRIIRIHWWLKATLDRKMAADVEEKVELLVFHAPKGELAGGRRGLSNQPDEAEMAFDLPSGEWALGETIEGQLLVHPLQEFDVTEVRVELVRVERVTSTASPLEGLGQVNIVHARIGSDPLVNEARHVEKVKVAGGSKLQPGEELVYPFRLTIPSPAPVTCHTGSGEVTWLLKGVLARRLRSDTQCEAEILVAGARA
jgi:sporulation-control protein spo0M